MGVSNWKLVAASGFAAVLSVLKGWAATKVGDKSFSLVGKNTASEESLYGDE
jgi:Na+(H+)/acetate symporter ActP